MAEDDFDFVQPLGPQLNSGDPRGTSVFYHPFYVENGRTEFDSWPLCLASYERAVTDEFQPPLDAWMCKGEKLKGKKYCKEHKYLK